MVKAKEDVAVEPLDVAAEGVVARTLEEVLTESLRGLKSTVVFEVADKSFGNGTSFSVTRQFVYDVDCDADEWLRKGREAADMVKALAFEQMGSEARRNDNGVLERVFEQDVMKAMPGSVRVEGNHTPQQPSETPTVSADPPHTKEAIDDASETLAKAMRKENTEWAGDRFYAGFEREFYDNRESNKARGFDTAPDYKHKTHRHVGFWLPRER